MKGEVERMKAAVYLEKDKIEVREVDPGSTDRAERH